MKTIILLINLIIAISLNAQIINIPDLNFKTKLLNSSSTSGIAKNLNGTYFKIDINSDGNIEQNEASQVSYLNLSNYLTPNSLKLGNLTGIEYFTNLTYLDCKFNNLSSINISSNINLVDLICNDNILSNLTMNNNNSLRNLICGFNFLTNLNLNNALNLNLLRCNSNLLTYLNISNNSLLSELVCYANQISNLNLNNNSLLSVLNCNTNQLNSLNVSNNNVLTEIRCINNQISSLNTNNNIILNSLICENNQILSLNLSNNLMLKNLSCSFNQLSVLNLNNNILLTTLLCNSNQLINLFIKNGKDEYLIFDNNPNLNFICTDQTQLNDVQNQVDSYGLTSTCSVNSNCLLNNKQFSNTNLIIFPNPANDILQFDSTEKISKIEIYDISGKILKSNLNIENNLNLSEFTSGSYILKVYTENGITTSKIIKN